jgi:hypothetical protein
MVVALTRRNQAPAGGLCIPHAKGANPLMRQKSCYCALPDRLPYVNSSDMAVLISLDESERLRVARVGPQKSGVN